MAYYRASGGSEKVASGSATITNSSTTTVNIGFKPKKLVVNQVSSSQTLFVLCVYDEDFSTSKFTRSGGSVYLGWNDLGTSNTNRLYSINNDGFTYNKTNNSTYATLNYFAIG